MNLKTLAFISFSILYAAFIRAQPKVQWASEVISFSSELKNTQYAATQVLGPPSIMPSYGQSPCAWASDKPDREANEFVEVRFAEPQQACQVIVAEGMNPGAIFEIYLFDSTGKKFKVLQRTPAPAKANSKEGQIFVHKFPLTPYKVQSLRLVLMSQNVPGYNQIDAIGISTDSTDYELKVEDVEGADLAGFPENLGEGVNSKAFEIAPLISADGQVIYFTRQKHQSNIGNPDAQDIWYAVKDSTGNFGKAINLGEPINNSNNNALCAVLPDGQTLMLMNKYLPDGRSDKGISLSFKTEKGWSFPQAIDIEDYYNENRHGEYALAADGKTLLMAIQRKDAVGDKDVYVSFRKEDGSWTAPKNLGPEVNTADAEVSPYLAADGRTLYFASGGYPGYGGQDMFVSRRLDDTWTHWSRPQNLGPNLNTAGFDAYYSVPAQGDYAYFSTSQGAIGLSDIFRVKLPESARPQPVVSVYGKVLNAKTKEPLGATISYESLASGLQVGMARSHPVNGDYRIILPSGDVYGFLAKQQGFLSVSQNIDLKKIGEYQEMRVDLMLTPIEAGANIRLNNLFFDPNKFNLKPEDELELNRIAKLMEEYPNMQIEISGHTDNLGSDPNNIALSNNRAKAVVDYLSKKGIEASRLQAKGLGKSKPVADNSTAEGRAMNRRIEMTILKVE